MNQYMSIESGNHEEKSAATLLIITLFTFAHTE
jgi:hypothetical protein